jgi:hypothetical protein
LIFDDHSLNIGFQPPVVVNPSPRIPRRQEYKSETSIGSFNQVPDPGASVARCEESAFRQKSPFPHSNFCDLSLGRVQGLPLSAVRPVLALQVALPGCGMVPDAELIAMGYRLDRAVAWAHTEVAPIHTLT